MYTVKSLEPYPDLRGGVKSKIRKKLENNSLMGEGGGTVGQNTDAHYLN